MGVYLLCWSFVCLLSDLLHAHLLTSTFPGSLVNWLLNSFSQLEEPLAGWEEIERENPGYSSPLCCFGQCISMFWASGWIQLVWGSPSFWPLGTLSVVPPAHGRCQCPSFFPVCFFFFFLAFPIALWLVPYIKFLLFDCLVWALFFQQFFLTVFWLIHLP